MNPLPTLPCLCSNVRRASRALTQLYGEALRPVGLNATQFTILQALSVTGEISQGRLGEILVLDSTTLTRTLAIMTREQWIAERRGEDRRERWLRLTKAGAARLARSSREWERVQSRLRKRLGQETWNHLLRLTHQVTTLATKEGDAL
jgi:DNA-binding MarR family transcriptional regulator